MQTTRIRRRGYEEGGTETKLELKMAPLVYCCLTRDGAFPFVRPLDGVCILRLSRCSYTVTPDSSAPPIVFSVSRKRNTTLDCIREINLFMNQSPSFFLFDPLYVLAPLVRPIYGGLLLTYSRVRRSPCAHSHRCFSCLFYHRQRCRRFPALGPRSILLYPRSHSRLHLLPHFFTS